MDELGKDTVITIEPIQPIELKCQHWINVNDRLPEKRCDVFVCYGYKGDNKDNEYSVATFDLKDNKFLVHFTGYVYEQDNVTHWMEIPEHPGDKE